MRPTKAGTGRYLELAFVIVGTGYYGRHVWARINLVNPSPRATRRAAAEYAALSFAVGLLRPVDPAEFVGKELIIDIACRSYIDPTTETDAITNEVARYARATSAHAPATHEEAPWQ